VRPAGGARGRQGRRQRPRRQRFGAATKATPVRPSITANEIKAAGGEAVANSDSVTSMAAVRGMVEQAKDTFGGLHAIINPAGILRDGMFHKMTDEDWDKVIEVHLRGAYNVSRASVELFREQQEGSYVHFTSTSGLIGNIGQANYAAAKLGVMGLSRILAMEGAIKNVRSNIIAPFAWTRMIASIPVKDEASALRVERMKNAMRADQVAQLAVALASPERRAAIVSPIRTAVGKFQGGLSGMTAGELGAAILRALVERTKIDPERVDDVIFAQGYGNGEAPCHRPLVALAAGFPISVPGYQLDRRCGSGLQAVIDAAMMVQTGAADVVIAGGVESMSNVEYYTTDMRNGARGDR
jgi:NAD(P)-dependent dehydrogenase (short-subunit alcohol dehydrogenase family)